MRRRGLLGAVLAAAIFGQPGAGEVRARPPLTQVPPVAGEELVLSAALRVRVRQGRIIELQVLPRQAEGYAEIAESVTGSRKLGPVLEDWNGGLSPVPDRFIRVPLSLLSAEYRWLVLRNLFPRDRREGQDWIHVARAGALPTYDEGLWQVAEWFTGDGSRFSELQRVNGLTAPELTAGQQVRIPVALLHPAFRPRSRSDDQSLEYGEDAGGPYAGYRLKPGEALYSAVVVRYTGRTSAEDVNALAGELALRSGIADLTDIPVGFLVKIPFDVLEPEFLPADHPRRREVEAARAEMAEVLVEQPVARTKDGLRGVLVIIDPGHGGRDLGTMNNGIWEHDYVYDVACRLKHELEALTEARVFMTLEDRETGCAPSPGDRLRPNRQGTVMTNPPFLAKNDGEARIAVNLRWYLANSVYRRAVKDGTKPDRVIFVSLHADARHHSLRGLMVYVPGARFRTGQYGHSTKFYRQFREVREQPRVSFSYKTRIRSEAVSRKLADKIVESFRQQQIEVHSYKPVRDRIIRGRREWIPAVLRGNQVPAKVLVELVNLANRDDAEVLAAAAQRERLSRTLLGAIFDYFGEPQPRRPETVASR